MKKYVYKITMLSVWPILTFELVDRKLEIKVMPLDVNPMPYFLIPYS
jgi:hypothetical protein